MRHWLGGAALKHGGCIAGRAWAAAGKSQICVGCSAHLLRLRCCLCLGALPATQDNCLALMGSTKAGRAVQQAATTALLQLVQGLKHSLLRYQDPQLAASEYSDAAAAAAATAAAGGPAPTDLASCLNPLVPKPSAAAGFREAAKALAAAQAPLLDPSCPNSYPQLLLPDLGPDAVWRLPTGALQGARVDVTATVASICLQVRLGLRAVLQISRLQGRLWGVAGREVIFGCCRKG